MEDDYVLVPCEGASDPKELPEGVVRVTPGALAAARLLPGAGGARAEGAAGTGAAAGEGAAGADEDVAGAASAGAGAGSEGTAGAPGTAGADGKVRIAVFDFDGTTLTGNSPVLLVRHLAREGKLAPTVIARIIVWGGAYKARLPQNESWVRGLVFSAFHGKPVAQVNEYLRAFYRRAVAPRVRAEATRAMQAHLDAGHVVVCVSATFEPIVAAAMLEHPIQYAIATRMKVDAYGCYTTQVEGLPVEGEEKVAALARFADERFGAGKWEVGWAYGDHHSDRALLASAREGHAVTPDRPLKRTAQERGYEILDWE
ncbi:MULTISPECIES: HAD family phosphatase [unclassified Adlercreutzia]|uniref:HAD family hydrolase n=1 Tax=unclassified Adlercreutzia TaxID=2636013 RepID=UPI0013EAF41F|nr:MULTISPECIES: HAD family hydrolase [unclassified Adlercreutzia]